MALSKDLAPSLNSFNPECGYSSPRPWDAPGALYGDVTTGNFYTLPGDTKQQIARAIWVGSGTGDLTLELVRDVTNGVPQTVTFTITGPMLLPLLSGRVTAAGGTLANIRWIS